MLELARGNRKSVLKRDIEAVPAFRQHLSRNGLRDLAEFEAQARQNDGGSDAALLDLRHRYSKVRPRK